jgi:hypothetical protein
MNSIQDPGRSFGSVSPFRSAGVFHPKERLVSSFIANQLALQRWFAMLLWTPELTEAPS